jgi:hypothetical protein
MSVVRDPKKGSLPVAVVRRVNEELVFHSAASRALRPAASKQRAGLALRLDCPSLGDPIFPVSAAIRFQRRLGSRGRRMSGIGIPLVAAQLAREPVDAQETAISSSARYKGRRSCCFGCKPSPRPRMQSLVLWRPNMTRCWRCLVSR